MAIYDSIREENFFPTADSVRQYLRDMGSVLLLSKEGELALARKIERGHKIIYHSLAKTQLILDEVLTLEEKIEMDLHYVANQSFFLDMKIILRTVANILLGRAEIYEKRYSRDKESETD